MCEIVIKNYRGEPVTYNDVDKVMFNTSNGGTQIFSKGEAVDDVPISLDFSSGENQTITAPDGTLVKSAVINKPVDLVSEKIVKGATIAGIKGTYEAKMETLEVTENGTFTPGDGVDGFSSVQVNVKPILGELNATKNGVYTPEEGIYGFSSVTVDVKSDNICYIGTSTPDSTIGNDGDLYIVKG